MKLMFMPINLHLSTHNDKVKTCFLQFYWRNKTAGGPEKKGKENLSVDEVLSLFSIKFETVML